MYSFFPVFSYYLQDVLTEPVRVGLLRDLADADLVNGLAVQTYRISEDMEVVDQGFEDQFRLRIDYVYGVSVVSKISEAVCNETASGIVEILSPGSDVSVTYDGTLYNMYIDKVKDTVEFKNAFFHEVLTFTGRVYSRLI